VNRTIKQVKFSGVRTWSIWQHIYLKYLTTFAHALDKKCAEKKESIRRLQFNGHISLPADEIVMALIPEELPLQPEEHLVAGTLRAMVTVCIMLCHSLWMVWNWIQAFFVYLWPWNSYWTWTSTFNIQDLPRFPTLILITKTHYFLSAWQPTAIGSFMTKEAVE